MAEIVRLNQRSAHAAAAAGENMIHFTGDEVVMDCDEKGNVTVSIPEKLIRERLGLTGPDERRRAPLDGVGYSHFIELSAQANESGRKSEKAVNRMLSELAALVDDFSREEVNAVLNRIHEPKKANMAYLKTAVRNNRRNGSYDRAAAEAAKASRNWSPPPPPPPPRPKPEPPADTPPRCDEWMNDEDFKRAREKIRQRRNAQRADQPAAIGDCFPGYVRRENE